MRRVICIIAFAAFMLPAAAKAQCTLVSSGETRPEGRMIYNSDYDVHQVCLDGQWKAVEPIGCPAGDGCPSPNECTGTQTPPAIGETCTDGTIYAGLSPDGNVPMYTTPADAPSLMTWNDGSSNWVDTAMENCASASPGAQASCRTGRDNTDLLVGLGSSPSPAPYVAANYCNGLGGAEGHGHDDWYLPAQDELNVLYVNLAQDGGGDVTPGNSFGFDRSGSWPDGWYWSSSEGSSGGAMNQSFSDGTQGNVSKLGGASVRCVRKGA